VVEYVTESGILVTDRRHSRAFPRDNPPNENPVPDPPVSVGPNASEGFGNTHVMHPYGQVVPEAWSGWPVEWATPRWGSAVGLAEIMARVSTVFTCMDLNASVLATMPPYRLRWGEVLDPLPWMVNPQPEVYTGWIEALKQVVFAYQQGEVFLWATRRYRDGVDGGPGTVANWVMLNPTWVNVEMDGQLRRYTLGGADITGDVLHIRYASWPGDAHGHGPLEAAVLNMVGADALERYGANLATRGGIPWATLTAPGNLRTGQADEMRERFVQARLSAMGAPAVLSGGVKLDVLTLSPKDMALLELRQFDESRLAVLLGVPPFLVGLPSGGDSMTYSNVSSIFDYHWRAGLRPKAAALMEAIGNWALANGQRLEVNRDEYVRPDFAARVTAYAQLFGIVDENGRRAITIDEIRTLERLNVVSDVGSTTPAQVGAL